MQLYILDDSGNPQPVESEDAWCRWMAEDRNRITARTVVGRCAVSTVFLGRNWGTAARPIYWHSAVFGGAHDGTSRYAGDWAQALTAHDQLLELVRTEVA